MRGGSLGRGQEAAAACHKWTSVCGQRLGKEGHKQKFQRRSSCGSCGFLSAKDAGQLEQHDWTTRTSGCILAVASFLCVILNEKSDNSSGKGYPIGWQIPELDRGACSWPLNDLESHKSWSFSLSFSQIFSVPIEKWCINQQYSTEQFPVSHIVYVYFKPVGLTVPQIALLSSSIHFLSMHNISTPAHLHFPSERQEEMGGLTMWTKALWKWLQRGDRLLINGELGGVQGWTAGAWTVWELPGVFLCVMHANPWPPWLRQWHKEASVRLSPLQLEFTSLVSLLD